MTKKTKFSYLKFWLNTQKGKHKLNTSMFRKSLLISALTLIFSSGQAFSESNTQKVEPLALQVIMQDMDKNMQLITHAISGEDWTLVEKTAPLIANHPKPPMSEMLKIMAYMGKNMTTFKAYDVKTHDIATQLEISASSKEGADVISTFAALQNSCLACHQQFRKPFQQHFYSISK